MKKPIYIGLIFFLLFLSQGVKAQKFNIKDRYTSIGLNLNAMNYVGELDPGGGIISPSIPFTRPNIGVCIIRRLQPKISLRGNLAFGRIEGDDNSASYNVKKDIHRRIRGLNFRNDIIEVKVDMIYDIFGHIGHFRKRVAYTPYVAVGLAYFHHNPKGQLDGKWIDLQPLSTEGQGLEGSKISAYSLHQVALPVAVGFRYKLGLYWDLAFEIGWRFTLTDYLDDVSGNYYDRNEILRQKGETAYIMADRSLESVARDEDLRNFVETRQGYLLDPAGNIARDNYTTAENGFQGNPYVVGYGYSGQQRGDKNKDWYIVTGLHLTYIIPERLHCPKFR